MFSQQRRAQKTNPINLAATEVSLVAWFFAKKIIHITLLSVVVTSAVFVLMLQYVLYVTQSDVVAEALRVALSGIM